MKDPSELPNSRIELHPGNKGTPSDLRPTGQGWHVQKSDNPVININLASADGQKPGLLEEIHVLGENVNTVTIKYRAIRPSDAHNILATATLNSEGFTDYNHGHPIHVHNTPILFHDPATNKPGMTAYQVRITVVEPVDEHKPYDLKLKIHACILGLLLYILYSLYLAHRYLTVCALPRKILIHETRFQNFSAR